MKRQVLGLETTPAWGPLRDIAVERKRQREQEGWTPEHDDAHTANTLAEAAACYAMDPARRHKLLIGGQSAHSYTWPFDNEWWKPTPEDRYRELVKAGALIVAEMERIKRTPAPEEVRR